MPIASEKEIAFSGYIINLYKDIEMLNRYVADYSSKNVEILSAMDAKKNTQEKVEDLLDEDEKKAVFESIRTIRSLAQSIDIKVEALHEKINDLTKSRDYTTSLDAITNTVMPSFEAMRKFALAANKIFMVGIMADLLQNSNAYLAAFTQGSESDGG